MTVMEAIDFWLNETETGRSIRGQFDKWRELCLAIAHIPHDKAMSDYLANYKPKFLVSAEKISGTEMPGIVMKKKEEKSK